MLLKKMIKKIKNLFYAIPISIKVTAWYTFFIVTLISIMLSSAFLVSDILITDAGKQELIEGVHEIASKPKKFESFDDGVFFIKYSHSEKIEGLSPGGFDVTLPFSKGPKVKTYKNEMNETFFYYDLPLKPKHFNNKHPHDMHNSNESFEWIRGVFPVGKYSKNIKTILILISIFSPILIFLIIYGGYKIIKNSFKPVQKISDTALEIQENRDFSKRIELGNGKDEIHKMAETFNKMLDTLENSYNHEKQFSSDVSHELRTPVTVILAESDYAINYSDSLDEAKDSLSIIQRQSKRMSNLITQIMELSKLERQNSIELENINISRIIETILSDYKYMLENANIELITNIESDIEILGNKLMLERVFDNLLSNALKFTKSKIYINLYRKEKVILEVEDDGLGMSKKELENIWHRFYQANSSRNKNDNQGYGLGLSMVRKIVKLHNASIEVESEIDKGSKFTIKF